MATLSTSTVERLVDLMLDIKNELKGDIARVEGKVDEVEGKVDEALVILKKIDVRLTSIEGTP